MKSSSYNVVIARSMAYILPGNKNMLYVFDFQHMSVTVYISL